MEKGNVPTLRLENFILCCKEVESVGKGLACSCVCVILCPVCSNMSPVRKLVYVKAVDVSCMGAGLAAVHRWSHG
jgi:hypothetical protein